MSKWLQGCCVAASYGMTDTMGRMHSDAQFAGSSSVP
ncbi:GGGtGRT protein, partial [Phocaeicola vulgatus]|nr:GGGtGRT protein [Phocaeicola vulgatus]